MQDQHIPIVHLKTEGHENAQRHSEPILENEIEGISIEHVALTSEDIIVDSPTDGHKEIYLFITGSGHATVANTQYELVPETILLPNIAKQVMIQATKGATLHYLKISSKLTAQDHLDLKEFPQENTQQVYYAKFTDCQAYTEEIKSPNTVSRTILPNRYIPRIAMGTVQTQGPDEVGAHEHPMLEQLFLGLSENNCTVYADDAQVEFPQYSLLHIPLGSRHSVSVSNDKIMYYVWMDFFLDKTGEEWLKTHKVIDDD